MALASSPVPLWKNQEILHTNYKLRTTNYEPNAQHSIAGGSTVVLGAQSRWVCSLFFWFRYSSVGVEHSCRTAGHWNSGTVLICTVPDCSRVFTFTVFCVYFYTVCVSVFLCFCVFSSGSADDTAMPGNRKKKKAQKKKHMFLCIE